VHTDFGDVAQPQSDALIAQAAVGWISLGWSRDGLVNVAASYLLAGIPKAVLLHGALSCTRDAYRILFRASSRSGNVSHATDVC